MKCPLITEKNMEDVWKYGCRKFSRTKKAYVIRKAVFPLGLFLFSVNFLILTYGVLYTIHGGIFQPFLQKTPYIPELWMHFSALVFDRLPSLFWKLAACAILLYIPAAVTAMVIALCCRIFYFPTAPVLIETPSMYPQSLTDLCEKIRQYSTQWRESSAISCRFLYLCLLFAACMASLFYFRKSPDLVAILQPGWIKISLYLILIFFLIYGLYRLLIQPLFLLFRLLSSSGPDDHFVLDAEYYCRQMMDLSCNLAADSASTAKE